MVHGQATARRSVVAAVPKSGFVNRGRAAPPWRRSSVDLGTAVHDRRVPAPDGDATASLPSDTGARELGSQVGGQRGMLPVYAHETTTAHRALLCQALSATISVEPPRAPGLVRRRSRTAHRSSSIVADRAKQRRFENAQPGALPQARGSLGEGLALRTCEVVAQH